MLTVKTGNVSNRYRYFSDESKSDFAIKIVCTDSLKQNHFRFCVRFCGQWNWNKAAMKLRAGDL